MAEDVPIGDGPEDSKALGSVGIASLGIFLVILPLLLVHLIVVLWPPPSQDILQQTVNILQQAAVINKAAATQPGTAADKLALTDTSQAANAVDKLSQISSAEEWTTLRFFGLPFLGISGVSITVSSDVRMLLLVIVLGAFGSYVHMSTSFVDFAGNRRLVRSWVPWYLLRPLSGGALSFFFYLTIRAGFLTAQSESAGDVNRYGIAAIATLVGLFSKQATDKLQEVFCTLFKTDVVPKRSDALNNPVPSISQLRPNSAAHGAGNTAVIVNGAHFVRESVVRINGVDQTTTFLSDQELHFAVPAASLAEVVNLALVVYNPPPGGGASAPVSFTVS
jgi:hypothetical protein